MLAAFTRVTSKCNGKSGGQERRGMKLCCLEERQSEIQKSDRERQFCSSSMPKWSIIVIFTYFIIFKMDKN